MQKGKIIFLNGTSSSGKTTLAKCLQDILEEPFYHLCCDTFYEMASEKFRDDVFRDKSMPALNHCIQTFASIGNNVIVDHVLYFEKDLKQCVELLVDYPVLFVGVKCPIEELERREKIRGDRRIGMAKGQYNKVHLYDIYDITVNTYENTTEECADKIRAKLKYVDTAGAFKKLYLMMNVKKSV